MVSDDVSCDNSWSCQWSLPQFLEMDSTGWFSLRFTSCWHPYQSPSTNIHSHQPVTVLHQPILTIVYPSLASWSTRGLKTAKLLIWFYGCRLTALHCLVCTSEWRSFLSLYTCIFASTDPYAHHCASGHGILSIYTHTYVWISSISQLLGNFLLAISPFHIPTAETSSDMSWAASIGIHAAQWWHGMWQGASVLGLPRNIGAPKVCCMLADGKKTKNNYIIWIYMTIYFTHGGTHTSPGFPCGSFHGFGGVHFEDIIPQRSSSKCTE